MPESIAHFVRVHRRLADVRSERAVILGIGSEATRLLCAARDLGIQVRAFVSPNPGHWGRDFEGLPVTSLARALRHGCNAVLVPPSVDYSHIVETLGLVGRDALDVFACEAPLDHGSFALNNRLLAAAHQHVRDALKDPALQTVLPASRRWQEYLRRIADELDDITTVNEAILYAQRKIGFNHRSEVTPHIEAHCARMETRFRALFPEYADLLAVLDESPHSDSTTLLYVDRRRRSNVFYYQAQTLLNSLTHAGRPAIVAEIGSGTGELARLWLDNPVHRPACVLIDWPHSLFFAEVFLRKNFPELRIRYLHHDEPLTADEVAPGEAIFCPLTRLPALRQLHLDLVINTGSMQEMTEEWVDFFMDWLSAQPCRFLYSVNYFAQPLAFMAESANSWSPRLSPEWHAVPLRFGNDHLRPQLALFAEKRSEPDPLSPADAARAFADVRCTAPAPERFFAAMDLFRRSRNADLAWGIVEWCMDDPAFRPKELWYLVEFIAGSGSRGACPRFAASYRELSDIRESSVCDTLPDLPPLARVEDPGGGLAP